MSLLDVEDFHVTQTCWPVSQELDKLRQSLLVEALPGTPCIESHAPLRRKRVLFADWVFQHPNNDCAYASF